VVTFELPPFGSMVAIFLAVASMAFCWAARIFSTSSLVLALA
jgi:hypothetical protein